MGVDVFDPELRVLGGPRGCAFSSEGFAGLEWLEFR